MNPRTTAWPLSLALTLAGCAAPSKSGQLEPTPAPPTAPAPSPKSADGGARRPPTSSDAKAEPTVAVLLDEGVFTFDEQSRLTAEYILRYRILRAPAVETSWATVATSWAPWHEARPELSAKVQVGGKTLSLDPKTLEESGARGSDPKMFRDVRNLRAPLPGIEVGAVVETRTITKETRPYFEGGKTARFYFGGGPKTEKAKLTVVVPAGRELRWLARGFEVTPKILKADGKKTYVFEGGPYEPPEPKESYHPPDLITDRWVDFSIAEGWAPIASAYAQLVKERIGAGAPALDVKPTGEARDAVVAAVLAAVHEKVRYTGLELGAASIEPAAPAAVLERGYGDCKDKATLVVAALRARGIEAHVALLKAGYATEVPEKIPALNHFDHAIVYVPGAEPLWLDATVEAQPVRDVPLNLQGRQALVARHGTSGLMRIPELPSEKNFYREVREVKLADWGPGKVVESSQGRGTMDRRLRQDFEEADPKAMHKSLSEYVETLYGSEKLVEVRRTGASSPTDPLRLELEVDDVQRAFTGDDDAGVQIKSDVLYQWLPRSLRYHDAKESPRKTPFFVYEPYRAELLYRITPPPGFVVREAFEPKVVEIGPARLERWYRVEGEILEVGYRFDTGPRRYTPAQVDAFARALAEVNVEEYLNFDHEGPKLLAQGRVKDALDVHARLLAAQPRSAEAHARHARALMDAGFGLDARAAANRAVALEGDSFIAQFTLGTALASNQFGRAFTEGMDRAGALAAYRAAKKVNPDNRNARYNIALLLQHDPRGRRWAEGADLAGSIAEFEAIEKDLEDKSLADELRIALLQAGRFVELEKRAEKDPKGDGRDAQLVAAVAVNRGATAAAKRAQAIGETNPTEVLQAAGRLLLSIRRYALAAEVLQIAARSTGLASQAGVELLGRLRPYEERLPELAPPVRTAFEFMATLFDAERPEAAKRFVSDALIRQERALKKRGGETLFLSRQWKDAQVSVRAVGQLGRYFGLDTIVTMTNIDVQGSDRLGYRVHAKVPGPKQAAMVFYLVKEKGSLRLRAAKTDFAYLGAEAQSRLERGDVEGARQWIDWGHDAVADLFSRLPKSEVPIRQLWTPKQPHDAARIAAAAAVLMSSSRTTAARALAPLERALKTASGADAIALRRAFAMASGLSERPEPGLPHARALFAENPDRAWARGSLVTLLLAAKRHDEAKKLLEARLSDKPLDPSASMMLFRLYFDGLGEKKKGLQVLDDLIEKGDGKISAYNEYAWSVLFTDLPRDEALLRAERAAASTKFNNLILVHTLASVYAEADRPAKAMQAFLHILKNNPSAPQPSDWYVFGRIAEAYGLRETALRSYRLATADKNSEARSTKNLARAGLRRLRAR